MIFCFWFFCHYFSIVIQCSRHRLLPVSYYHILTSVYSRFRNGIKDLEVMMQNLIVTAFETVTTVEQGVEVLDVFMHLSSREVTRVTILPPPSCVLLCIFAPRLSVEYLFSLTFPPGNFSDVHKRPQAVDQFCHQNTRL